MKVLLRLASVGCSLPLINAGWFKWNSNSAHDVSAYVPAHETGNLRMHLQPTTADPEPTSPPELKRSKVQVAERRDTAVPGSVCGYISNDLSSPMYCPSDNTCLFTAYGDEWVAGCCPTTSTDCPIQTTCVDSDDGGAMTEIGISTLWCWEASYPKCVTYTYEDKLGYSIYNCGGSDVITTQDIYHSLDASESSTLSTSSALSASASTAGASKSSTTPPTSSTTMPAPSATSSKPETSTPIGAIVGGAVGGVVVIAIVILGIIFFIRKTGKKNSNQPPVNQGPPAMHQQQASSQPFEAAVQDPRYSIPKAPHHVNTHSIYAATVSSPGSPPPPDLSPSSGLATAGGQAGYPPASPASPASHGQGQGAWSGDSTFQPNQQQNTGSTHAFHNQGQPSPGYYEMPATRHDGELRELA